MALSGQVCRANVCPLLDQVGIPFTHVATPDSVEGWKARQGIPSLGLIILGRFRIPHLGKPGTTQ